MKLMAFEKKARAFLPVDKKVIRPFERKARMLKAGHP